MFVLHPTPISIYNPDQGHNKQKNLNQSNTGSHEKAVEKKVNNISVGDIPVYKNSVHLCVERGIPSGD